MVFGRTLTTPSVIPHSKDMTGKTMGYLCNANEDAADVVSMSYRGQGEVRV